MTDMGMFTAIGAAVAGAALAVAATFGVVQASNNTPAQNPAANTSKLVNYGE